MGMDKIIEKKKGLRPKHIIWIAGGLAFTFLLYKVIFAENRSTFRAEKDRVTISAVEDGLFNDYITVIGQVEPITTIYMDAIEGGQIQERFIEEGSMVKKGDVILRLENRQLEPDHPEQRSCPGRKGELPAQYAYQLRNGVNPIAQEPCSTAAITLTVKNALLSSMRP